MTNFAVLAADRWLPSLPCPHTQAAAEFLIELYPPDAVSALLIPWHEQILPSDVISQSPPSSQGDSTTRIRYVRVRAVDVGVPKPKPKPYVQPKDADANVDTDPQLIRCNVSKSVPFVIILEPLYWGILPASQLLTVSFLVTLLMVAITAVPWIISLLDPYVQQARQDPHIAMTLAKKGQ